MMSLFPKPAAFLFWLVCLASAVAQSPDPFSKGGVAADPFVKQPPPAGKPVEIRFQVIDQTGAPVDRARIGVTGTRVRFETDVAGVGVWRTTDQQLARLAKANAIRLTVFPPKNRLMPRIHRRIVLQELTGGATHVLRGRPGIRLQGKVIGKTDKQPLNDVTLYVTATTSRNPKSTPFITSTDHRGEWNIVVPRLDARVVADKIIPGYDLGNGKMYAKTVKVTDEQDVIVVPVFEIEQIAARKVHVLMDDDQPVHDARVDAWYFQRPQDDFVLLRSISPAEVSGVDGTCHLKLVNAKWDEAFVWAKLNVDGVSFSGRTTITPEQVDPVTVRLSPPVAVQGLLTQNGKPAAGVPLVIYETVDTEDNQRGWISIGLRGEATTDSSGGYGFQVESGIRYAIALQRRSTSGRQQVLHRTPELSETPYVAENVEIEEQLQANHESP